MSNSTWTQLRSEAAVWSSRTSVMVARKGAEAEVPAPLRKGAAMADLATEPGGLGGGGDSG